MSGLISYSGIATKTRAMSGKLLSETDFENIAGLRSVLEVIEYLKTTPAYGAYINLMDISLYHRGNIEKMLYQSLYDDYGKLYRFAGMEQRTFLVLFGRRYEIELLNYCFRIIFNRYEKPFDLEYKRDAFDRYSQIDIDRIITAKTVEELVEGLKGTDYYKPLKEVEIRSDETLFDFDMSLTIYYYSSLIRMGKKYLKGKDLEIFLELFRTEIDLQNLQWIYRAKKYYDMTPAEIYRLTIPQHYHLKINVFKKLVESLSMEDLHQKFTNTYYDKHWTGNADRSPESRGRDYLRKLYLSERKKNPYSGATMSTYLFLKEHEIDRLTTALECIRYSLPKSEIMSYLGGEKVDNKDEIPNDQRIKKQH